MSETIGILGGMGPEATVRLFNLIVKFTSVKKDQDHVPMIIFNNPKIPDRSKAIIEKGNSPLPLLLEGAKLLENAGASFIVMPCCTAHYYYDEITKHITIPFLHLQEETRKYVECDPRNFKRFGLLATSGTIKTKLFQTTFNKKGLEVIVPDGDGQERVMKALFGIRGIKQGEKNEPRELLLKVIAQLKKQGAKAIIAGCTEVSLVLNLGELELPVIDPLKIIAKAAILKAEYELKR